MSRNEDRRKRNTRVNRPRHRVDEDLTPFPPFPVEEEGETRTHITVLVDACHCMESVRLKLVDGLNQMLIVLRTGGALNALFTIKFIHGKEEVLYTDRAEIGAISLVDRDTFECKGETYLDRRMKQDEVIQLASLTQTVDANGAWCLSPDGISVNKSEDLFIRAAADIRDVSEATVEKTMITFTCTSRIAGLFVER